MPPAPRCSAPTCWWQMRALFWVLFCCELLLGTLSVGFIYCSPPSHLALRDLKTSPRPTSARVSWCLETSSIKTPFPGWVSVPSSFVSLFMFYILSYLLLKTMGCFSVCLMSSAGDQKLFCEVCSAFNCSFNEFVGEKVVSPSFSSTILAPPHLVSLFILYIYSYLLSKMMDCLSGCMMSSASIQKLFCGMCSVFKCPFDEFVGEKVVSPSYSSAILGPPPWN